MGGRCATLFADARRLSLLHIPSDIDGVRTPAINREDIIEPIRDRMVLSIESIADLKLN